MNRHPRSYTRRQIKVPRRMLMTVCIAAICDECIIIGASDRQVTIGDGLITTNPPKSKSSSLNFRQNDSIAIMIAGNMDLQSEIISRAIKELTSKLTDQRLSVNEVLNAYTDAYHELYFRFAESSVLIPQFFMDARTYKDASRKGEIKEPLLGLIQRSLSAFEAEFTTDPDNIIETIIAGCDADGVHLYKLRFDEVQPATDAGYVAIGHGAFHADSRFQINDYTSKWRYADALFLLYEAKRNAEHANTVGDSTDMFRLFPLPMIKDQSTFERLSPLTVEKIRGAYEALQKSVSHFTENLKVRITNDSNHETIIQHAKEGYKSWKSKQGCDDETRESDESGV